MNGSSWDAVVVGGGPAGLSAALMLGRARRRVVVVDAGSPRNRFADHMHGVLGHDGVAPRELLARGRAETAAYGVEFVDGTVERVEERGGPGAERGDGAGAEDGGVGAPLVVTTSDGATLTARAVVVATGVTDELPDVPGLAERWGATVLHCPYCHGWEVRDRHLAVLTTSPLSLHQAELVRQWSDRVTVFTAGLGSIEPAAVMRLRARGIRLVAEPVVAVLGDAPAITAVRTSDGREHPVDAIFTGGVPQTHDAFLASLSLARDETPVGSVVAVDGMGRTSHPRVWAAGNVTAPTVNVPLAMGAGAMTGSAVNAALVGWDADAAVAAASAASAPSGVGAAEFWEDRYAGADRIWSGRVNRVLEDVAAELEPGTALDLGCGEGADVLWLAERGWRATGVDISATAVARALEHARQAGLDDGRARFVAADLAELARGGAGPDVGDGAGDGAVFAPGSYDLVTASFLHSPVELRRDDILRRAAALVAPGGHLLVTSHAAFPGSVPQQNGQGQEHEQGHADGHAHGEPLRGPREELDALRLDAEGWETRVVESRHRETVRDGAMIALDDVVVLVRRR